MSAQQIVILLLCVLALTACVTPAKFETRQPLALTAGTKSKSVIKVSNWKAHNQLVVLPGGPYINNEISLPVSPKLIAANNKYVVVISAANELCVLDFSKQPARQAACLPLVHNAISLAAQDNRVFVGFESEGVWLFDIGKPNTIKKLTEFVTTPNAGRIRSSGQQLFVLCDEENIHVYRLDETALKRKKNPPVKSIALPARIKDFEVIKDRLLVIGPDVGMSLVDTAQADTFHTRFNLQGELLHLTVNDGIAYVANGSGGLVLVDISNPEKFVWLGSHNKLDTVDKVLLDDQTAYVVDRGIRIASINIRNKSLPITGSFYKPSAQISDVVMEGGFVYLATANGIEQIVFPPKSHQQISNEGINQGGSRRAFIADNIAYVADWFSGLHLYDISNPQLPRHLSNYHTPGSSKGVVVADGYAYVGDDDHGLQIIDVSDPRHPKKVSEIMTSGLAYTLKKRGNLIYLADHRGGFDIIDVTDVHKPVLLSSYDTPGKSWAIDVTGDIAFVADDTSGLLVFDVSNRKNPVQIGQFNPKGNAEDVVIKGNTAYVSFFDQGFYILDISKPAKPEVVSHLAIPGNARSVAIENQYAYIAGWESGLNIVDISNPAKPFIAGSYDTKGSAWGADIKNGYAYVWDWWGGVKVVDIKNPSAPKLAGKYHTRGEIRNLRQKGNYIYTANGSGGVQVFDIKNAVNPIWTAGIDLPGQVTDVWPSTTSDHVYAVSNTAGLVVLDVHDPFYIRETGRYKIAAANLVRQSGQYVYVATQDAELTSFNASNPDQLKQKQVFSVSIKDMWIDSNTLYAATINDGLIAFDINKHGQLKRRHTKIQDNADRVLVKDQLMASAIDQRGLTLWKVKKETYSPIAHIILQQNILDFRFSENHLLVYTRESGLLVYDISDPSLPRLRTRYPATDLNTRFIVNKEAVFFAGTHTIASVQLLPDVNWSRVNSDSLELAIPAPFLVGEYHLAIVDNEGNEQLWPNAISVTRRKPAKPRITPQQFEKLLKKYRSQQQ